MYRWLNDYSQQFLEKDYLLDGQSVDDRVNIICQTAEKILGKPGFAARFKENFQKGWYSLSTPIWTNFGTNRGMGISCFSSYISDDMPSILYTQAEIGMMSKYGGGTSAYLGNLRGRGSSIINNGKSSGSVHFARLYDNITDIVSQGSQRRGSCAVYLPIDHADINEFLTIKTEGSPIQNLSFGVCVSDDWMRSMIAGDTDKRKVWAKVLETRTNIGYPYIFFTDNANNNKSDVYKDNNLNIYATNLCTEVMLPSNEIESFVCDLSSMNILYYDEWKDTDAVELLVYFLDAVMSEFVQKAKNIPFMDRTVRFAERHRALGIGWLGWHTYLQSKMIPWESMEAKYLNVEVAKTINKQSYAASRKMAKEYGEPDLLKGYGRRHTTLMAIAPTKSSSFILGQVSEGIEPHRANYYIKDLAKGKFTIKNKELEKLLDSKGKNSDDVWTSILKMGGSVQHLNFLSDHEKAVFKTFAEISQKEVVIQAAQRQKYIDQGQSLNLMIHPDVPAPDINRLVLDAWEMGVKSLYYQHSVNAAQQFSRNILNCTNCES